MKLKELLDELCFTYKTEDNEFFKQVKCKCWWEIIISESMWDWKIECKWCWIVIERLYSRNDDVIITELWNFINK